MMGDDEWLVVIYIGMMEKVLNFLIIFILSFNIIMIFLV